MKKVNSRFSYKEIILKLYKLGVEAKSLLHKLIEEEHYRLIVENSTDLITTMDTERRIFYISPSCLSILGYTREELLGLDVISYVHPDDRKRMVQEFSRALGGQVHSEIFRVRHKDGTWKYIEVSEAILLIENSKPYGLVTFGRDITERIENEKRKDEFISILSHELKTPLTTILMLMSFLEKKIPDQQQQLLPYYSKLEREIAHFSQLIHMLVDVSEIEQGILYLEKEEFLLNEFVKKLAHDWIDEEENEIIVHEEKKEKVYADKKRLEEVVNVLFSNALKYSSSHRPIAIGIYQKDGFAEVSITDFGMGIPGSEQEKIFEKFYQFEDHTNYPRPGLGIGLYFAREIIKKHNGKLWVKSEHGKGSTFYFSLPLFK